MAEPLHPQDLEAMHARLFAEHQRRLFLYIRSMVPAAADAEEILQETNVVIWKKLSTFDPETDFLAWAFRIAHLEALAYRRKRSGMPMASLTPQVMEQLGHMAAQEETWLERRRQALSDCRRRLEDMDRVLVERCYAPGANIYAVAESLRRSATSVYRSLRRIRRLLAECIDRRMAEEA